MQTSYPSFTGATTGRGVCSVAGCGFWQYVLCGSMWIVTVCVVWQYVDCDSMCSVAVCGL